MRWCARFSSVCGSGAAFVCLPIGDVGCCFGKARSTRCRVASAANVTGRSRTRDPQSPVAGGSAGVHGHCAALLPVRACFPQAGARNPQNPLEARTVGGPWPAPPILAPLRFGKQRSQYCPLRFAQQSLPLPHRRSSSPNPPHSKVTLLRPYPFMQPALVPGCPVRAAHGDTVQFVEEIISNEIDVAIVTLPVNDLRLHLDEIRRDRLVVCLRGDHPLAAKAVLRPGELQENLTILYHPQRHPSAHERLLELLAEAGLKIDEYSRASHPTETQELVKQVM